MSPLVGTIGAEALALATASGAGPGLHPTAPEPISAKAPNAATPMSQPRPRFLARCMPASLPNFCVGTKWERALLKGSTERFEFGNDARVLRKPNKRLHLLPRLALATALGVSFAVGFTAHADAQPASSAAKRRVVVYTEGARSAAVSDQLKGGLPSSGDIVDNAEFKKALAAQGQKLPLGLVITLKSKRGAIITRWKASRRERGRAISLHSPKRRSATKWVLVIETAGPSPLTRRSPRQDATRAKQSRWRVHDLRSAVRGGAGPAGRREGGSGEGGGRKQPTTRSRTRTRRKAKTASGATENGFGHEISAQRSSTSAAVSSVQRPITTNLRDTRLGGGEQRSRRGDRGPASASSS